MRARLLWAWNPRSFVCKDNKIEILRQGPVSEEELAEIAPTKEVVPHEKIVAPGQTASHYAPDKILQLFAPEAIGPNSHNDALICWGPVRHLKKFLIVRSLSETRDLRIAAQRLFSLLREMDRLNIQQIYIEPVPEIGLGKAIMNRIRRASAPRQNPEDELTGVQELQNCFSCLGLPMHASFPFPAAVLKS